MMMTNNPLGNTGIMVSPLGLGTVKLGRNQDVKYPAAFTIPDDQQAGNLIACAREAGINLIDTAPAYGNSEERLGKLLAGQRQDWIICSKAGEEFHNGQSSFNFTPEHLRYSIARSLQRLNTDYLDLLLIHSDGNDTDIIQRYEVFDTLATLKQAGWIRAFGFSGKTCEGGLLASRYADVLMVTFNTGYQDERPVIEACHQNGVGVLIKKALASGHLASTGEIADPVQQSMNLVLGQPGVSSAIIGTINPTHLLDNVRKAAAALHLKQARI